jgi:hypothetical protein
MTATNLLRAIQRPLLYYALPSLGVLAVVLYAADYAIFRYRVAKNYPAFGQVTVNSYDAVPQKNGRTQYIFLPPQTQSCSKSLFP